MEREKGPNLWQNMIGKEGIRTTNIFMTWRMALSLNTLVSSEGPAQVARDPRPRQTLAPASLCHHPSEWPPRLLHARHQWLPDWLTLTPPSTYPKISAQQKCYHTMINSESLSMGSSPPSPQPAIPKETTRSLISLESSSMQTALLHLPKTATARQVWFSGCEHPRNMLC